MKCQCCKQLDNELLMFEICRQCGWENDINLEFYYSDYLTAAEMNSAMGNKSRVITIEDKDCYVVSFPVGYELNKIEREAWSTANGDTPNNHYNRWIANDKQINYY